MVDLWLDLQENSGQVRADTGSCEIGAGAGASIVGDGSTTDMDRGLFTLLISELLDARDGRVRAWI